ncbi:MAG: MFS transporter [Promethearchaeota archaeon]|nr:MAG: MFS transporter [Candidatus Lokiarchaeota archaeon]
MLSKKSEDRFTSDFSTMINIAILNSLGFFFLGFLVPVISRQEMNATGLQIGLIVSSMVFGYMISSTFVGIITDRAKSKKILIFFGSIGRGISYFIFYFSIIFNYLLGMLIGMLILGLGAGFFWIPFDTLIAEKSNKNNRSQAFGKRDSANAKGQVAGGLIGFGILLYFTLFTSNPYLIYSAIILFGIANFIAGLLFVKKVNESLKFSEIEVDSNKNSNNESSLSLIDFPKPMLVGLMILFALVLLSSINGNLWRHFLNIYILENLSDNLYVIILIYLPTGLLAIFIAPKLGEIVDKLNPSVAIVILSLSGAFVTWCLINTTNLVLFAILLVIDLTVAISAGLLFRNLLSRISVEHRGKILGICSFFVNAGSIIGPILGGYVWDAYGFKAPFIVSIYVELCLLPLYLIVVRLVLPHAAESFDSKEK